MLLKRALSSPANRALSTNASSSHCQQLVKTRDYERFLGTLLLPKTMQRSAFAVRAFNAEIANVGDAVKEKTIGLMRMQFWKDTIAAMYTPGGVVPGQPVAQELHRAAAQHGLSQTLLLRLISSRETLIHSDKPFPTLDDVESYAHDAFTSVNYLLLECLGDKEGSKSGHVKHVANQLGKAEGIVTLLRAVPYNAEQRRKVYLPTDLMSEHRVSAESVLRGTSPDVVVEILAARAQEHLENARFRAKYLSSEEKGIMLPAVLVDAYLARLARVKCNVFDGSLRRRDSLLPARLFWHSFKRSF